MIAGGAALLLARGASGARVFPVGTRPGGQHNEGGRVLADTSVSEVGLDSTQTPTPHGSPGRVLSLQMRTLRFRDGNSFPQ